MSPELNLAIKQLLRKRERMSRVRLVKAIRNVSDYGLRDSVHMVDDAIDKGELFKCQNCKTYVTLERMLYCEECLDRFEANDTTSARYRILQAKEFTGELTESEQKEQRRIAESLSELITLNFFRVEELTPIPLNMRPSDFNRFHSTMDIGRNVEIQYCGYPSNTVSYLIIIDKETGCRLRVDFKKEGY